MTKLINALIFLMMLSPIYAEAKRPNILWLFSDDHAFQAIGAYGGRFENLNLTPNLDSIAKEGLVFDRAYVGNSICAPSRATLLTGKHSHINGKIDNRGPFNHDQQQFQKILQKNGYETAMIGKIHLSGKMQGFDYWEVLPGQGKYWDPSFVTEEGKTVYKGEHSTDVITKRALNWLENDRSADKPFMLMVHYKAPHRAWQPTTRWKEKFSAMTFPEPDTLFDDYKGRGTAANEQDMSIDITMRMKQDVKAEQPERQKELAALDPNDKKALIRLKYQWYMRDYLACIAGVDENIGFILDHLKASGLDKNTIVMYSADQGFYLGEHGWFDKRLMYEESYRTPLIAKWPGVTKPSTRNSDLVQNIDFAETFLDIAGIEAPEDMQGESLVPILKGESPSNWRKHLYYHYYEYPGAHSVRRHEGVSGKRFKLIRFYGKDVPNGEEWEFFDLKNDPKEMTSQYKNPEYAAEIAKLKKELANLRDKYEVAELPQKTSSKKKKKK
ncbi:sulfatase [Lentisphaera marina]|uniref:sulfatase family protein n=1 Tax=Lentisphaera marina TaxID=1111041 RepID=UPI0023653ECB|nr:sulfatase [Lentisphaera marina]MDD7984593.1 sulfatase [Lentisphaera marina]